MLPTTKTMIADAFLQLTKGKAVDKITVKDIVETCHITRQTFYYHFKDVMDVVEWSLQQKMVEILEKSLKAETMQGAVRILLSGVEEHPEIIYKLMNSQKREQTERLLISTIRTYLQELIDKKELFLEIKHSDMEMALSFYSYAVVGVMLDIIQNRRTVDIDVISRQMCQLIPGEMYGREMD